MPDTQPENRTAPTPPAPAERQAVETWERELATHIDEQYGPHAQVWLPRAARQKHGWAQGEPLTRAAYLAALEATATHTPES